MTAVWLHIGPIDQCQAPTRRSMQRSGCGKFESALNITNECLSLRCILLHTHKLMMTNFNTAVHNSSLLVFDINYWPIRPMDEEEWRYYVSLEIRPQVAMGHIRSGGSCSEAHLRLVYGQTSSSSCSTCAWETVWLQ